MAGADDDSLFRATSARGECRVVCYSPRHDLSMGGMSPESIRAIVDVWATEHAELSRRWTYVQIFENRGESMGCSNPHPHGQIWASDFLPSVPAREAAAQADHLARHGRKLLTAYAEEESRRRVRVIDENDFWVSVVPYWAVWPFESLLVPRRPVKTFEALDDAERDALARILKIVITGYDALFDVAFPYSMGWHPATSDAGVLHAHFYPPLLRSAAIRKYMVGYEMLGEPQRDLTPETAAELLRASFFPQDLRNNS